MAYYKCGSVYVTENSKTKIVDFNRLAPFESSLSRPFYKFTSSYGSYQHSGTPTPQAPIDFATADDFDVCCFGVNVWREEWEQGSISAETGEAVASSSGIRSKNLIKVYSYQQPPYFVCSSPCTVFCYNQYKEYTTYITVNTSAELTLPTNTFFLKFATNADYGNSYKNDIGVNFPSSYTQYIPFQPSAIIPINIGQYATIKGDVACSTDGHLTVTSCWVSPTQLNAYTWQPITLSGKKCFSTTLNTGVTRYDTTKIIINSYCSTYKNAYNTTNLSSNLSHVIYSDGQNNKTEMVIRDDAAQNMTGEEFKVYVSGRVTYEHNYRTLVDQQISKFNLKAGVNNFFNTSGYGSKIWYVDIDGSSNE